jgi:hypothetical protein
VQASPVSSTGILKAQSESTQANVLNRDLAETSLQNTSDCYHEVPNFIYSYDSDTDQLYRTNLINGDKSNLRVPSYTFKTGCCWSEVPAGDLLITGGRNTNSRSVREVVRIDTRREFAVSHCPPMLTPRFCHAAVYHTPHFYTLGGWEDSRCSSEC